MKSTYHVFEVTEIYTCFSAYAAIHLGQKGGRNLDEIDAAKVCCCSKSGEIAGNAASKGNYKTLSVQLVLNKELEKVLYCIQVFMGLSCRESKSENMISYL